MIDDGGLAMRLCCLPASSLNIVFSPFFAARASLCNSSKNNDRIYYYLLLLFTFYILFET